MKAACYGAASVWLAVLLACGGGGSYRPAATGEPREGAAEAMYQRCTQPMEQTQCGTSRTDSLSRNFDCIHRIAEGYYALDTYAQRQAYLIQQGCPPGMVTDVPPP